jgi:hypothetical protein
MGRFLRVCLSVAVILTMTTGPALATQKRSTKIDQASLQATLQDGQIVAITGFIVSNRKCLEGRTVVIKSGPDTLYGAGLTNAQGQFTVQGSAPPDTVFQFTVTRSRVKQTICLGTKTTHTFL